MKIEENDVIFSTGRTLYANNGIIGIGPNEDSDISEGYDGDLAFPVRIGDEGQYDNYLTDAECYELADYMIARWTRFREQCITRRYRV